MCVPVSVVTGGATSGCLLGGNHGILAGQITALIPLCGALVWNFRRPISRRLSFRKA